MKNSKIEWTTHTFNPVIGCTKVSPGCANCYAAAQDRRWGNDSWGPGKPRRRTSANYWRQPRAWDNQAEVENPFNAATHRPRVFCGSLCDWLDEEIPVELLADLLDLIRRAPNLDWLLLSKRPQNWHDQITQALNFADAQLQKKIDDGVLSYDEAMESEDRAFTNWLASWLGMGNATPPANVWIGTSVEDQPRADERIPHLLRIPARVRFLSCEPLLGEVEIADLGDQCDGGYVLGSSPIHWVICGGESGPKARPMQLDWARSLRDQCAAAGVAFFFKQWGEHDERTIRMGKARSGRLLDGREHNEFPTGGAQ